MVVGGTGQYIWALLEAQSGDLWLGTMGGGVSRYDGREFDNLTTEDGLSDNYVYSLLEDSQGNVVWNPQWCKPL